MTKLYNRMRYKYTYNVKISSEENAIEHAYLKDRTYAYANRTSTFQYATGHHLSLTKECISSAASVKSCKA